MDNFEVYRRVLPNVFPIIFRNFFVLVNGIIFVVVVLLYIFGNTQAGFFLGIVFILNTFIATAEDIHARILLERLQMLTALHVVRIDANPRHGGAGKIETLVLAEEIKKGDLIKLKLGDQAPCEGVLTFVDNLEISEALVTGESDSFSKKEGDKIIAGAIITSGHGIMEAEGLFCDSRLSFIAGEAQKFTASPSSIEQAINLIIKYSSYVLIAVLVFVVSRGFIIQAPKLEIVNNVGALASTLVPQGLVVAITILFAVGAAYYSRKGVLFQEINSTEKLGRIKNLCIDKTGTLTDNILRVEQMHSVQGFSEEEAYSLTYACIRGLADSSETILAVKKYIEDRLTDDKRSLMEITKTLPFSSWRRYGAVEVRAGEVLQIVFVGAPDIMFPRVSNIVEKKWLQNIIDESAKSGKRVLCVAIGESGELPKDLKETKLSIIAIFVFHNTLRQGIEKAIKFFQDRGVKIRVLSGDNALTVKAVAQEVGIKGVEDIITGQEIEKWTSADFEKNAHKYTIFAQIMPEHKVKLVKAFKKDGFTAMVGDGVNDALAMKESDVGIAMWDGVPVTRTLADVILMDNSFSSLPGAVELADHFIRSIEISSGIYINQSVVGFLFFIIISIFGFSFPFLPLNITFMNYFTVGFSTILISYWALRPSGKVLPANNKPYLKRILPIIFACGIVEAIGVATVFMLSPQYLKLAFSNTLAGLAIILFGFLFFIFAGNVYSGSFTKKEKSHLFLLSIFEIIVFLAILQIPFLVYFFNITIPYPSYIALGETLLVVFLCGIVQYFIVQKFFLKLRS